MTDRVRVIIDGQEVAAPQGEKLLWTARDAGIEIPSLCANRELSPPFGACRLCWVEIEGWRRPVTSCTVPITDGMVVTTRSPAVDRLVASSFELLMSHHKLECKKCPANHACGLQKIAISRKLKLKPKRVQKIERTEAVDDSHPLLRLDQTKCILCGLCVWACREHGQGMLDFAKRGLDTVISTVGGRPLADVGCHECTACGEVCPVGALSLKDSSTAA